MLHNRDEAREFTFELARLPVFLHTDDDDLIWDKIVKDAKDLWEQSHEFLHSRHQQNPFLKSERPDILYECDDFVMGIECSEFDASLRTHKGSMQKQKERQTDKDMLRIDRSREQIEQGISISKSVNVNFSIEHYTESLLYIFRTHANKIAIYRNNITKKYPGKKVYLSFYIEDTTALGNYILTLDGREAIIPLCVKEFILELSKTEGIDYIITNTQNTYVYSLHIQKINSGFLDSLYKESYDFSREKYLPYNYTKEGIFSNENAKKE